MVRLFRDDLRAIYDVEADADARRLDPDARAASRQEKGPGALEARECRDRAHLGTDERKPFLEHAPAWIVLLSARDGANVPPWATESRICTGIEGA